MALLALSFQPVSAALFSVRDTYEELPGTVQIIVTRPWSLTLNLQQQMSTISRPYLLTKVNKPKT